MKITKRLLLQHYYDIVSPGSSLVFVKSMLIHLFWSCHLTWGNLVWKGRHRRWKDKHPASPVQSWWLREASWKTSLQLPFSRCCPSVDLASESASPRTRQRPWSCREVTSQASALGDKDDVWAQTFAKHWTLQHSVVHGDAIFRWKKQNGFLSLSVVF